MERIYGGITLLIYKSRIRCPAMRSFLRTNKFFMVALLSTLVVGGLGIGNFSPPSPSPGVQVINGVTFNFSDYSMVPHESLALFNYLNTLVSRDYQGYGEWGGWYAEKYHGLHHYVLAFMDYAVSELFETTPGYRSDYYRNFAYDLIKRMNTSEAEWGVNSIEYKEWTHPDYNYVDYYWPNNSSDPNAVYIGGWRGPANIMWTGHYSLMEALYERNFHTGEFIDELTWFINDWNKTLLTDRRGNPKEGGMWGVGLIPCEPYVVFVQCNSIPMTATAIYDHLQGTNYLPIWDYGRHFINTVMQDKYGLFIDGYYVDRPTSIYYDINLLPETIPGPAQSLYIHDGRPRVSSYCDGWALAFLEYFQENETAKDYPMFIKLFKKDVSSDKAYIIDSYNNPSGFGTYDILGTLFTMHLASQRGDYALRDRLMNFLYGMFNKVWSPDGRMMHYDTMALEPFLQPILALGHIWATSPNTIKDLVDTRPNAFWHYPYISKADDANIWVYQAQWDPNKSAFILSVRVDRDATLTFSNFNETPTAYAGGTVLSTLSASTDGYSLTLVPGMYNLVIM